MPNYKDEKSCFINNLIDAGCSNDLINKCQMLKEQNKMDELIMTLTNHKKNLLAIMHTSTERIDCLDYLICKIRKEM